MFDIDIDAGTTVKKLLKQKFSGLQVIIFIAVCAAVYSLYGLHKDNIKQSGQIQHLQATTVSTNQFQGVITDMTQMKGDVAQIKSDIKDIKTTILLNHLQTLPLMSEQQTTNKVLATN